MQNKTLKTSLIIALTAVITVTVFIFLMPVLGPRFMHPLMAGRMHNGMNGMHGDSAAPSELDYATERTTDNGAFKVSYTTENAIAINQMHTWVLHIETADGQPVEDAIITVDGGMPQHGHGLPTAPQVTEYLGNGDYLVEGMKFQMGGWWEVKFNISAGDLTDTITFNLTLEG